MKASDRLVEALRTFSYQVERIEWRRDGAGWACWLSARSAQGDVVRNLEVKMLAPFPPITSARLSWGVISMCPIWVKYLGEPGMSISINTDCIGI